MDLNHITGLYNSYFFISTQLNLSYVDSHVNNNFSCARVKEVFTLNK